MSRLISFLRHKRFIQFLGITALAVLVWFVGPLVAVAGHAPLEDVLYRSLFIAFIYLGWVVSWVITHLRGNSRERQLLVGLASGSGEQDEVARASAEEQEILSRGFAEALKVLNDRSGKDHRRGQRLYDLPWYAIIGAPGSGKTTALINSGLRFPLAEHMGQPSVKGVGGTRNCDWWFTDEAVLLDTAGRYTTQDSHQAVDATAWESFLQLLKQHRPRRPLNGLIVTISATDLLQQTEEQSRLQATALRKRIHELYDRLGIRLPIYVMVTKSDLVAGFTDFFADLTEEQRAQVWGETFPYAGDANETQEHLKTFQSAYDELIARLQLRVFRRIQAERDLQRRAAIADFPKQMALLKPSILRFLDATFSVNRYEQPPLLRGLYLTSGTQEGTPIDRVLGTLANVFRLDRQTMPLFSGKGKSYFLTTLLRRVIFPEAGLAGIDPKVERRRQLIQLGAYVGVLAIAFAMIATWTVSYSRNKAAIGEVEHQLDNYRAVKMMPTDSHSNVMALLPRLNALLAAHDVYEDTGWSMGAGLYQGDKLQTGAQVAYDQLLRTYFQPLVSQRLAERMAGSEGDNPEILYQLLRVYLMFGDPQRLDPKVVTPWIKLDWEREFAADPQLQAQLITHLNHLLALPLDPSVLDDSLVSSVRAKLTQQPRVNQIYSQFRTEVLLDHDHDIKLAAILGPMAGRVFVTGDGKDPNSVTVPGLFSAYGYQNQFLKKGMAVVKESAEQNWVLGLGSTMDLAQLDRLYGDFKRLYLADYQRAWSGLLLSLQIRAPQSANQLVDSLDILSRPDSPLRLLLELVEKNTTLSQLAAEMAGGLAKSAAAAVAPDSATQKLIDVAKQTAGVGTAPDPIKSVEDYFEPFNSLIRTAADRPAPFATTLTTIKALHDYLMQMSSAPNTGGQALQSEAARFAGGGGDPVMQAKMEFTRLPDPIKTWLMSLTNAGGQQLRSGAKGQLSDMVKGAVAQQCKAALTGRYPFSHGAPQDVLMADFAKLFAANGIIDQFFTANLKPFVDTTGSQWREFPSDKALGLSAASLHQFQLAAKIRDAFFGSGALQVSFELKPVALDKQVSIFRLNIEGQDLVYRHGPEQIVKFQWPGPNPSAGVRVVFEGVDGRQTSRSRDGPWALFRILDDVRIEPTALPDRYFLTFQIDSYTARFELRASSVNNPFGVRELDAFRCPEAL